MKKTMLSAAVFVTAFSANADSSAEMVVSGDYGASVFDSFYFGMGAGGQFFVGPTFERGLVAMAASYCETNFYSREEAEKAVRERVELNGGTIDAIESDRIKDNRFNGSLVIGGGRVFHNNLYVGGEFILDLANGKEKTVVRFVGHDEKDSYDVGIKAQVGRFIPQASVKLGCVFKKNTLTYVKLGCTWSTISVSSYAEKNSTSMLNNNPEYNSKREAAFVAGFGIERNLKRNFSVALDADYNCGWVMNKVRVNKGWTVRALVKYNVNY